MPFSLPIADCTLANAGMTRETNILRSHMIGKIEASVTAARIGFI